MIADFIVLSATTVLENYSWDIGVPFDSGATTTTAYSTSMYVSGYAPGLNVLFRNTSEEVPGYEYTTYTWNFGDYYNDTNNVVTLSAFSGVEHLYIMPGKYNVSLTLRQTRLVPPIDPESQTCIGKYDIRWLWNDLQSGFLNSLTWNETECTGIKPKWWDSEYSCIQKHCKVWLWQDLKSDSGALNPITWEQTKTNTELEKKWVYEPNDIVCTVPDANFLNTLNTIENTTIKVGVVEVLELPPEAQLQCLTSPLTGVSPYTVTLSPRSSIPGSFPIDRIDWDFNDGTPIKTVTRYTSPDSSIFTFTNTFFNDQKDPRNYDAVYSYVRKNNYSVFYPSITCYSSNTFTKNSCSLTIGPILLPEFTGNLEIVKQRNTENGILYAGLVNTKLFFAIQNNNLSAAPIAIKIPQNNLVNNYNLPNFYYGNPGLGYPVQFNPRPFYVPPSVDFNYIILEEDEPRYPEPILTESNLLIKAIINN